MHYPAPQVLRKCSIIFAMMVLLSNSFAQDVELDSIKNLVDTYKEEDSTRVNLLVQFTKYHTSRDLNENVPLIEEALSISKKINYQKGIGKSLNAYSTFYNLKGEIDSAISKALQAKSILEMLDDEENLLVTNGNLGRAYFTYKQYDEALSFYLENVELVKENDDSSSKAGYYFYVAKTYQQILKLEEAEVYLLKALEISKNANYATGIAIAEGSLGVLYSQMKEYEKALGFLKKTLEFSKKYNQKANMAASYSGLTKCYIGLGDLSKALQSNQSTIDIYRELDNLLQLKAAYETHYELYEQLNDYKNANKYLKEYYLVGDSIFSKERMSIVEELETKYETEKKESQIELLSQQSVIQDLEIRQKNQWLIIGLIAFVLVGSITFFFVRASSIQKQKVKTELEQRFLRSQLNPHFISNALLAIQNFMLKNEANQAGIYLAKFSKLMRQILENSRQEFISVEEEVQMIQDYMDIHKLRLGHAFQYEINIDDNIYVEVDTIPPMFVQPFVENAIEHGLSPENKDGLIKLNLTKSGNFIAIEIVDNGKGLEATSTKSADHISLSTKIIRERMELFNRSLRDKIQLVLGEVKSENGEILGTKVSLKVPFSYS